MDDADTLGRIAWQIYMPLLYKAKIACAVPQSVREEELPPPGTCPFSEKFLQILWNENHLSGDAAAESGAELKILSPGIWNVSAGPDFRDASLVLGGHPVSGDVEIHRFSSDWNRHRHNTDPEYANVILHVVWVDDAPGVPPGTPTLVLPKYVHPDWQKLLNDLDDACYPYARQVPSGDCALRWAMTEDKQVQNLLGAAGLARFSARASVFARQAAEKGREQALYEAVFEALGYKNNRKPFRILAQNVTLEKLAALDSPLEREALLFGAAGLLPDPTREKVLSQWQDYVNALWDKWWGMGLHPCSDIQWSKKSARPYNSPHRRLAAGTALLESAALRPFTWLKDAMEISDYSPKSFIRRLESLTDPGSPWRGKTDFGKEISPPANLLGHPRMLDLAANVLLPFLAGILELEEGSDGPGPAFARKTFLALPPSQNNRLLKEAVQRFFTPPSRSADLIKTACHQQGIMDIYRNFCQALDNDCRHCPLCAYRLPDFS